jgi:hypothetical protein
MSLLSEVHRERLTLITAPEVLLGSAVVSDDPLRDLMDEFKPYEGAAETESLIATPAMVHMGQREDQAWVTLERQLDGLRNGLRRLNYYLTDVDDNLRR